VYILILSMRNAASLCVLVRLVEEILNTCVHLYAEYEVHMMANH
jgi:hypothetical protein